jgi:hypothetical protein
MIKVYGASDDLIEIEGAIREEFYMPEGDSAVLTLSDGTALGVTYDDSGNWRFVPLARGTASLAHTNFFDRGDPEAYSDIVTLEGDVTWVALTKSDNFAGITAKT